MTNQYVSSTIERVKEKYPYQKEYLQAVEEVLSNLDILIEAHPEYQDKAILQRLVEPDRIIVFKVPVEMDDHHIEVYKGYRVQFNCAIGPYKGGIRFNPNVTLSVMKFLGFEQTFKNALTTLPMGGAKGGSDFDPKGKSDNEIKRFCQSFMKELYRYVGTDKDIPAGDMGVGNREIGYLFGEYKRITQDYSLSTLTGKSIASGGSLIRTQATGYGLVYFLEEVIKQTKIQGKRVVVSGSGNVGIYSCEKCQQLGYQVIGISDSKGYVIDENINLAVVKEIKEVQRASLELYPSLAGSGKYYPGSIYDAKLVCDIVLPCGTQNEIDLTKAQNICQWGVKIVAEGANMPNDNEAINFYKTNGIVFVPGKASNAGGVATSGLEISQNVMRLAWSSEEVDNRLHHIMIDIHKQCVDACRKYGIKETNYVSGANIAAASKVIEAMLAQGDY